MKDVLQLPHKMLSFLVQWKNLATQKLARELEILQASLLVNIRELGGGAGECAKRLKGGTFVELI